MKRLSILAWQLERCSGSQSAATATVHCRRVDGHGKGQVLGRWQQRVSALSLVRVNLGRAAPTILRRRRADERGV
eukprot:3591388-Prymnesium_polylepis.1